MRNRIQTLNQVQCYKDPKTGEEIKREVIKQWTEKIPTDTFIRTYTRHIAAVFEIETLTARRILDYFMLKAEFNTGIVHLGSEERKALMVALNISVPTYYSGIKELVRCKVIEKWGSGAYKINPEIIWKGDSSVKNQILRYTIETVSEVNTETGEILEEKNTPIS